MSSAVGKDLHKTTIEDDAGKQLVHLEITKILGTFIAVVSLYIRDLFYCSFFFPSALLHPFSSRDGYDLQIYRKKTWPRK